MDVRPGRLSIATGSGTTPRSIPFVTLFILPAPGVGTVLLLRQGTRWTHR
jgi:hypothetical protein